MCRFVLYLGEPVLLETLLFKPVNSLVNQSYDAEERDPLNGDGFGVAWYVPEIAPEPAVFKSATPAWNNRNLIHLSRMTRSECVLAHVRAVAPGVAVSENNCHPFVFNKFSFMHNGDVGKFKSLRRSLLAALSDESFRAIQGETDSEHLFGLFLDCWQSVNEKDPLLAMAAALEGAINRMLELLRQKGIDVESQFNLAVSDGKRAVATRCGTGNAKQIPTLYWHQGRRYVFENGACHMIDYDVRSDTVIIASEPLSDDPGWEPLEPNSMILVAEDHRVTLCPLNIDANLSGGEAAFAS
ncbi:MAG TPA: class II glutamine amidotransferase [Candidatus Binatia bacterium]|nr:class II glutamine amidotransferase [Candidatus Binatia bacterium]